MIAVLSLRCSSSDLTDSIKYHACSEKPTFGFYLIFIIPRGTPFILLRINNLKTLLPSTSPDIPHRVRIGDTQKNLNGVNVTSQVCILYCSSVKCGHQENRNRARSTKALSVLHVSTFSSHTCVCFSKTKAKQNMVNYKII